MSEIYDFNLLKQRICYLMESAGFAKSSETYSRTSFLRQFTRGDATMIKKFLYAFGFKKGEQTYALLKKRRLPRGTKVLAAYTFRARVYSNMPFVCYVFLLDPNESGERTLRLNMLWGTATHDANKK
jgi:hypothetical protein